MPCSRPIRAQLQFLQSSDLFDRHALTTKRLDGSILSRVMYSGFISYIPPGTNPLVEFINFPA